MRARLLGDQRMAEHFPGVGDGVLDALGEPHAALGVGRQFLELALPAAAGVDLALDDVERSRKRLGGGFGLIGLQHGNSGRNRRAIGLE